MLYKVFGCMLLLLLWGSNSTAQLHEKSKCTSPGELLSLEQQRLLQEYILPFPDNTQFAFAFLNEGKVNFTGVLKIKDSLVYLENQQAVFEIGSITKVFTATLLAQFALADSLELDDNIQEYLGHALHDRAQVTFKQLANHTAGLPRLPANLYPLLYRHPENPYAYYTAADFKQYLLHELKQEQAPGQKIAYSNLGAALLGYTLGNIGQTHVKKLVEQHILKRYGMGNSTYEPEKLSAKLVKGLTAFGTEASNWQMDVFAGAGGLYSTAEDMAHFAQAHFKGDKVLELSRKETFSDNTKQAVALGWFIIKQENGNKLYWHNGATGGYTSSMALDIERKNGVIILSNISYLHAQAQKIDKLCFLLMETLLKE